MPITTSRREILRFVGGSLAGLIFTPIPWKLLDDLAIRTQNPPWTVGVPSGDVVSRFTTCTLCPSACGLKVRCIANRPISITGVARHPLSQGIVCPSGLGGHHIPYHPLRIVQPVKIRRTGESVTAERTTLTEILTQLRSTMSAANSKGSVVILDRRPGRVISSLYRKYFAGLPNGYYVVPHGEGPLAHTALNELLDHGSHQFGYDLEQSRTIVSFGTPMLNGWTTPAQTHALLEERKNRKDGVNVIQFETRKSRTGMLADRWIPIAPSSEALVALGLANIIISERLVDEGALARRATDFMLYRSTIAPYTPERVAQLSDVPVDVLRNVARTLVHQSPSIVIGNGDPGNGGPGRQAELAIAGLNLILGSVGIRGGIVTRNEEPRGESLMHAPLAPVTDLTRVPEKSISVLIIDETEGSNVLPWGLIEPRLVESNSLVVTMSPYLSETARRSDYVIPTPSHLEQLTDIPTPPGHSNAVFALSIPLFKAPSTVVPPVDVLNQLFSKSESVEDCFKETVKIIQKRHQGGVFKFTDGTFERTDSIATSDDLWKTLTDGAIWVDAPKRQIPPSHFRLLGEGEKNALDGLEKTTRPGSIDGANEARLLLTPYAYPAAVGIGQVSPILSKLYQESNLRPGARTVSIHPSTGKLLGLDEGDRATIRTSKGERSILIHLDNGVMPGIAVACVGPDPRDYGSDRPRLSDGLLDIVEVNGSSWNFTPAILRKA